jgi:mitochondrial fission protein ELM1
VAAVWPYALIRKQLVWTADYAQQPPRFRPSFAHVDRRASDPLEPPWPAVVFACGRRTTMVALRIKQLSSGVCKIVSVGRPRGKLVDFDLVVSFPPYRTPDLTNVLNLALPPIGLDPAFVKCEAQRWRDRINGTPRPYTLLLLGGPAGPLRLDEDVGMRLVLAARGLVDHRGTVFVVASRRTPTAVTEALARTLPAWARLYPWAATGGDNPYPGLLALADDELITSDSASMLVEAGRAGARPLILPLPCSTGLPEQLFRRLRRVLETWMLRTGPRRRPGRLWFRYAVLCCRRDLDLLHDRLVDFGLARWERRPIVSDRPGSCKTSCQSSPHGSPP